MSNHIIQYGSWQQSDNYWQSDSGSSRVYIVWNATPKDRNNSREYEQKKKQEAILTINHQPFIA